jgi:hypothetical protein
MLHRALCLGCWASHRQLLRKRLHGGLLLRGVSELRHTRLSLLARLHQRQRLGEE